MLTFFLVLTLKNAAAFAIPVMEGLAASTGSNVDSSGVKPNDFIRFFRSRFAATDSAQAFSHRVALSLRIVQRKKILIRMFDLCVAKQPALGSSSSSSSYMTKEEFGRILAVWNPGADRHAAEALYSKIAAQSQATEHQPAGAAAAGEKEAKVAAAAEGGHNNADLCFWFGGGGGGAAGAGAGEGDGASSSGGGSSSGKMITKQGFVEYVYSSTQDFSDSDFLQKVRACMRACACVCAMRFGRTSVRTCTACIRVRVCHACDLPRRRGHRWRTSLYASAPLFFASHLSR